MTEHLKLAREATNGWACYARTNLEHKEIARLHKAIDEAEAVPARVQSDDPAQAIGSATPDPSLSDTPSGAGPRPPDGWQARARPITEYHEDEGAVLWWLFPISEPPYCGTPGDSGWPFTQATGLDLAWTPFSIPLPPPQPTREP